MRSSRQHIIFVQNLTATHVTVWTNMMDRRIGAVLLFCLDRQTDRWSVKQSQASASAFAL